MLTFFKERISKEAEMLLEESTKYLTTGKKPFNDQALLEDDPLSLRSNPVSYRRKAAGGEGAAASSSPTGTRDFIEDTRMKLETFDNDFLSIYEKV